MMMITHMIAPTNNNGNDDSGDRENYNAPTTHRKKKGAKQCGFEATSE